MLAWREMTLPLFTASFASWRAAHDLVSELPAHKPALDGIVKLSIKAIPGARTAETLGAEREGTGVVIGADGLILTIGYLVLESDSILVLAPDGRVFPAVAIGFDHASGFGLVRASPSVTANPIPLGDSGALVEFEQVLAVTHPSAGGLTAAYIVARRRFTGYWEYMIDDAIFTAPPRFDHSGAALLDRRGHLIGIGSLWVGDALNTGVAFPGNMFVPIDLLKPVLGELIAHGRRCEAARPWLGIYTEEVESHVVVTRVLPDTPAAQAGMRRGDVILGVAGQSIGGQGEFYQRLWASGSAGEDVVLHILRSKTVQQIKVRSVDRLAYLRIRSMS
jgi:S1-C subfamily serine protease